MKLMNLRSLTTIAVTAFAVLLSAGRVNAEQSWPDHPIKLIVPFAPGGSDDPIARMVASKLSVRLGQSVIVENRGGAGSSIGTEYVAKARPDGYTLLFTSTSITTTAASRKALPYNPEKDLQPIGEVASAPFVIFVSNDVKARSLQELINLARAQPNSIKYGSAGVGGMNHLGTALFASTAKVQMVHVPYKGIAPAFVDLIGGNLQMIVSSMPSSTQYVHSDKIRGVAVTGSQRSSLAPDLPTASESALPGFQLQVWWGVFGPAGLPAPIVKRLNSELNAILALPEMQQMLARSGATARPGTPEALGALVSTDLGRWTKLIQSEHIVTE